MKGKRKSSKKGNVSVIKGRAQLGSALTQTSAAGAFVIARVQFDSSVGSTIDQLSSIFAKWRLLKLKLHFCSSRPTTDVGIFGMAILEDVDSVTPTTTSSAMNMRVSCMDHVWRSQTLNFKPLKEGWLFTRDLASDDRLEMPCDMLFFSELTTAQFYPGIIWYEYHIEWCELANSIVLPQAITLKPKVEEKTNESKKQ